jgi:hypothetical protein
MSLYRSVIVVSIRGKGGIPVALVSFDSFTTTSDEAISLLLINLQDKFISYHYFMFPVLKFIIVRCNCSFKEKGNKKERICLHGSSSVTFYNCVQGHHPVHSP